MGFKKAMPAQAAIKMSGYGPPGSGKTFSALLFAEGIAKHIGKRIAFIDSERGTDFYAMEVKARAVHPEAFDFDAIYTRSISEALKECKGLNPNVHGIIVIDSITHFWETAMASYTGSKNKAGAIPAWAWGKIKGPYKELMKFLIDSPYHVFILGRQSNEFAEDSATGEMKAMGVKMKAEGETAYEPHICLHFDPLKNKKTNTQEIVAVAEKDRSGILAGKCFHPPTFANVIAPVLGILGTKQAETPSDDEAAEQDAKAELAKNGTSGNTKAEQSHAKAEAIKARIKEAKTAEELDEIKKDIKAAHLDPHSLELVVEAGKVARARIGAGPLTDGQRKLISELCEHADPGASDEAFAKTKRNSVDELTMAEAAAFIKELEALQPQEATA